MFEKGNQINKGRMPWNKGVKQWPNGLTKETISKISKKLNGRKHSNEHVKKRTISRLANPKSLQNLKEQGKQLGLKNLGKKHIRSNKYRKLQSISQTKFWNSEKGQLQKEILSIQRKCKARPLYIQKILRNNRRNQTFPIYDTKPEKMMQIALALNGIKFVKQKIFDLTNSSHQVDIFIEPNICIEIDGDFWHANPMKYNSDFQITKYRKAKDVWARDNFVNHELNLQGCFVIRIWESDIKKNTQGCAENIIKMIKERMETNPL